MHRNALILTVLVTLLCGCASSRRQVAAPPDRYTPLLPPLGSLASSVRLKSSNSASVRKFP